MLNLAIYSVLSFFLLFTSLSFAQMEYIEVKDQHGVSRKFSRLIMGTDHLVQADWVKEGQAELSEAEAFRVLDEAVRKGINVIDTSPIYVGSVENLIGKWIKSRKEIIKSDNFYADKNLNPDRKIYVISKGGFPFDLFWSKELEPGQHSLELKRELKEQGLISTEEPNGKITLKNVPPGTYASRLYGSVDQIRSRVAVELGHTMTNLNGEITVYLMHRDDFDSIKFNVVKRNQTPVERIMEAVSSKEIGSNFAMLGWSNWTTDRVNESIQWAKRNLNFMPPMFNSPYFSLFEMTETSIHARGVQVTHKEMMDPEFQRGIYLAPYSPLGGFSILDKDAPVWENAKKSARLKYESGDPYWQNVFHSIFTIENEIRYNRALELAQSLSSRSGRTCTVDQVINAYALAHPRIDFLTVGPITVEQVNRTVESLKISKILKPNDLDRLHKVSKKDIRKYKRRKTNNKSTLLCGELIQN